MPLSCDCYGGCWWDHAIEQQWKALMFASSDGANRITKLREAMMLHIKEGNKDSFPYGTYVSNRNIIMFERAKDYELAKQLARANSI